MQRVDLQEIAIVGPDQAVTTSRRSGGLINAMPFWGLICLLIWAPLPFASNRPWSWSLLSLGVGVLLTLWALAALRQPTLMRLSWRRCAAAGTLFLITSLWVFLQTIGMAPEALHDPIWQQASRLLERPLAGAISSDPTASRDGLMRLIAYAGAFWLAAQYGRDSVYARRVIWSIALIGAAYAAYGITIFSTGNKWILWYERWAYSGDLTSTFISRSAFGAFAGMALLSALALLLRIGERSAKGGQNIKTSLIANFDGLPPAFYGLMAACLILATALMLTHSRGAVAVTAMGLMVMLTCYGLRRRGRRRNLLLATGLIAVAGIIMLEVSGRVTLGRTLQLADQGTGREAIHALTRRGIDNAPVTGHGLDTFPHLYFQYRDSTIPWASPRYDKAHNAYLELVLEMGLIGFLGLMAAIGVIILRIGSGVVRRRRDRIYPAWGLGVAVLIGAHALLDFSVQMPAVALAVASILGVAYAQSWPTEQATK